MATCGGFVGGAGSFDLGTKTTDYRLDRHSANQLPRPGNSEAVCDNHLGYLFRDNRRQC